MEAIIKPYSDGVRQFEIRKIPRDIAGGENFHQDCWEVLNKGNCESIRLALSLAATIYLKPCMRLVESILSINGSKDDNSTKVSWLEKVITEGELNVDLMLLCIVLSRQKPTRKSAIELLKAHMTVSKAYYSNIQSVTSLALALEYAIYFCGEVYSIDSSSIDDMQSKAHKLGLSELSLTSQSWINDKNDFKYVLEAILPNDLSKLSLQLQLPAQIDAYIEKYSAHDYRTLLSVNNDISLVDTGIYFSVEDYIFTQRCLAMKYLRRNALDALHQQSLDAATAHYKTFSVSGSRVIKVLPAGVGHKSRPAHVALDVDFSMGESIESHYSMSPLVLSTSSGELVHAKILTESPLIVQIANMPLNADFTQLVIIHDGTFQLNEELNYSIPYWFINSLFGESQVTVESTVEKYFSENALCLVEGMIAPSDLLHSVGGLHGRVLFVNHTVEGLADSQLVYEIGTDALEILETLIKNTEQLAIQHNLQQFFNGTADSAIYIAGIIHNEPLLTQLKKLAPLEVLDRSQHLKYMVNYAADVVFVTSKLSREVLWGIISNLDVLLFDSIVVYNAESFHEIGLISLLNKTKSLDKLILLANNQPQIPEQHLRTSFQKLTAFMEPFHLCSQDKNVTIYGKIPHELESTPKQRMAGFAQSHQVVYVKSGNDQQMEQQNITTARYSLLIFQYMRLLNYPTESIVICAETQEQKHLIDSLIKSSKNMIDVSYIGRPLVTIGPFDRPYSIVSHVVTKTLTAEMSSISSRRIDVIPGGMESSLEVVYGELFGKLCCNKEVAALININHMESYVQSMISERQTWDSQNATP